MSRTVFYFNTDTVNKDQLFAERWAEVLASNAFKIAGLDPVAMVRGVVPLVPEYSKINFGSQEKPNIQEIGRILLEMPDVASDDLVVVFADKALAEIADTDPEAYTEEQQRYWNTISGLFLNVKYIFGTDLVYEGCSVQTWEKVPGEEASKQFMVVDHIKNIVIERPQQTIVASPELVKQALERNLPLPTNLSTEELDAVLEADQAAEVELAQDSVVDVLATGSHKTIH